MTYGTGAVWWHVDYLEVSEHNISILRGITAISTLRPRRNGQHSTDDIFKRIFFNENILISLNISLKFVPKGPINNIPALVPIMAWRRPGDKPLSEPVMVRLPTYICVTRPQWVNWENASSHSEMYVLLSGSNATPNITQGIYWLRGKTSYRLILESLEATRMDVIKMASLWKMTYILAAFVSRHLSNFEAIGKV